ncbi:MAG: hypothetical protein M3P29_07750 [Acidobacteriota bacterium]|nr:hypothetical protein [Acidobacteriota bacterium]
MLRFAGVIVVVFLAIDAAASVNRPIADIGVFLDQCPDRDPAYTQIRADFEIRRGGVVVGTVPCTEPVSAMPVAQYTDELIILQGLRVIYYMDRGQSGHLPWTAGTLYDWMKSKIVGIDIVTGYSFCCEVFGTPPPFPPPPTPPPPRLFIAVGAEDDFNREFDKGWRGIAGNIGLYAHETRHVDGFPHSSCCGISGGCDNVFDPANLTPYGTQWWLHKLWLDGTINVGFECATPRTVSETAFWFVTDLNDQYRTRFCRDLPSLVQAPAIPFGACVDIPPRRRAVRK